MNDERGLLAEVDAYPGASEPLLVYADWLEERGRPIAIGWRLLVRLDREPVSAMDGRRWEWLIPPLVHPETRCVLPPPIFLLLQNYSRGSLLAAYETRSRAWQDAARAATLAYQQGFVDDAGNVLSLG